MSKVAVLRTSPETVVEDYGRLMDLGTKGTGQTPHSRFGDGRLTLKGGVREILATEMLEALGVETSKTFSVIETGEDILAKITGKDNPQAVAAVYAEFDTVRLPSRASSAGSRGSDGKPSSTASRAASSVLP